MHEPMKGDLPPAFTPKLAFSNDVDLQEIPAFLRRDKPEYDIEIADEHTTIAEVVEPETPADTIAPVEHIGAPVANATETQVVLEDVSEEMEVEAQPGLKDLTVEQLLKKEMEIQQEIQLKQKEFYKEVVAQIVKVATDHKIAVEDIVEALGGMKVKRKGVKAEMKYKDPVSGALWSGRGKEPSWIKDQNRDDFLIS